MQTIWLSPTEYVTGDPSLRISYPSVSHPYTIITSKTKGDLKWISLGLTLPQGAQIEEITICYQVSDPRSFISQVRLSEMTTPEQALVRHDDPTDLISISPASYTSRVSGIVTTAALILDLRLNFQNVKDKIMLGAVGVTIQPIVVVPSYPQAKLPIAGIDASLAHVTDGVRGLWMDQGARWFSTNGGVANTEEFDGADLGERFNKAVAALLPGGGMIIIPPGEYTTATELFVQVGQQPIAVFAYGAVIKTIGAISAIRITSIGPNPQITTDTDFPAGCSIYGLKIDHRGVSDKMPTEALYGFNIERGWNVRLYDPIVVAWWVSPTYAGIRVGSLDPCDGDAGSLWTKIINPWVQSPDSGTPITYGIIVEGASNATSILGGGIRNVLTGVAVRNQKGACSPEKQEALKAIPNAVLVDGVAFEGYETAIEISGLEKSNIAGLRIVNNRFEHGSYVLSITGIKRLPSVPPYLAGNMLVFSAIKEEDRKYYLHNPNNITVNTWDFINTPNIGLPTLFRGIQIMPQGGAEYPLDIISPGGNRGIHIRSGGTGSSAAVLITWTGEGTKGRISSQHTSELALSNIQGISATDTNAQNLRSSVTFAGSGTATVSLSTHEYDDRYFVTVTGNANENFWVTDKTTGGFIIHSSNLTSVATVDWHLIR